MLKSEATGAGAGNQGKREQRPTLDLSNLDKSKRLAKQNRDYLRLLSMIEKAQHGLAGQHAALKAKPAKDAAKQLLRQLDLILHMLLLPYMILMMAEGEIQGWREAFGIVIGKKLKRPDKRAVFEKRSRRTMKRFFALDVSGSLSRPWLSATTVYLWTAFECLAGDLWENSLNDRTALAHRTLNSVPSEETGKSGLSRRQIDVGLAARYGFDLRRCLGTLLKSKFDFSSFGGIEAAYKQAFGTAGDLEKYHDLKVLEQIRHLIVHRGGVVDEKFLKITKLKMKRGAPLSLKVSQVCDYTMAVTLACVALLESVDQWFATN